ncbi:hypothetical protein BDK51DRAFT_29311 [Blyttiomyces helicus]|uniref:Uncharacterized protein n=1 Tax=Blyttiomyces helicus TaxID=388810 RepID=A0A4P9WAP6_9FUNG|nr:hypothetical protein BDK51DRAFT_29311 [Blyttiomyces helicus]|eukprot:RKO89524.1 hypothetical protein BDK51DRAFT_29311 [Blyttiomyces helicus]
MDKALSGLIAKEGPGEYQCKEWKKLFKGEYYVKKHIKTKHGTLATEAAGEAIFINSSPIKIVEGSSVALKDNEPSGKLPRASSQGPSDPKSRSVGVSEPEENVIDYWALLAEREANYKGVPIKSDKFHGKENIEEMQHACAIVVLEKSIETFDEPQLVFCATPAPTERAARNNAAPEAVTFFHSPSGTTFLSALAAFTESYYDYPVISPTLESTVIIDEDGSQIAERDERDSRMDKGDSQVTIARGDYILSADEGDHPVSAG